MTPGACRSDFFREVTGFAKLFLDFSKLIFARTTEAGSRTLVAGIAAGEESHGAYMADCVVARYAFHCVWDEKISWLIQKIVLPS